MALGHAANRILDEVLDNVGEVHLFMDLLNAVTMALDCSHHSAQMGSLLFVDWLCVWLNGSADCTVILHHVTKSVMFEPLELVHLFATSVKVEAGRRPVRTAAFARKQLTSDMLEAWDSMSRIPSYIGHNFLTLRNKGRLLSPSHIGGGPWLHKVWGSNMLTARLILSVTGHAPIAAYHARFHLGDLPMEDGFLVCLCGSFKGETVRHVINSCGRYDRHSTKFHISQRRDFLPYVEFL